MTETKMLTIRDIPHGLINTAKRLTGRGTGSQAFIASVQLADEQADTIELQRQELAVLRQQVAGYQQLVSKARDVAAQLVEVASQGDLLLPTDNPLRPGYRR
jgi:hypothetical protein